jgi:hypothetical protein
LAYSRHYNWFSSPFVNSFALLTENPKVDGAVVFVHGFLGDPHETFYAFQDMVNSHATAATYWTTKDLFFFTYRSFHNAIETSARSLLDFIAFISAVPPKEILKVPDSVPLPLGLTFLKSK